MQNNIYDIIGLYLLIINVFITLMLQLMKVELILKYVIYCWVNVNFHWLSVKFLA